MGLRNGFLETIARHLGDVEVYITFVYNQYIVSS